MSVEGGATLARGGLSQPHGRDGLRAAAPPRVPPGPARPSSEALAPDICCHWLCLTLCDPMDCSPPGSSVHGILQARILEWVAMPSPRESSRTRDQIHIP